MPVFLCFGMSIISCSSENKEEPTPEPSLEVSFPSDKITIIAGTESEVQLTVSPLVKAMNAEFVVSDEDVVSIKEKTLTNEGLLLVLGSEGLGTATVSAAVESAFAKCQVEVVAIEVQGISLDKSTLDLTVGEEYSLKATIDPADATNPLVDWSSSDESVVYVSHGRLQALSDGTARITASIAGKSAYCDVTVRSIEAESVSLDVESKDIAVNETFIVTATILPENVTMKTISWKCDNPDVISYEVIDAITTDNVVAARVCGLKVGEAVLTASAGNFEAQCKVSVRNADIPEGNPKIGDYYYSDGTWSDGGLLSIESDGTNPVWKAEKPAPEAGKTVIGIVFQTDTSRLAKTDIEAGYSHGLVLCTKSAHAPGDSLTRFAMSNYDYDFENVTTGTSWYADLSGRYNTEKIVSENPGDKLRQYPAFDWTVTDFSPSAPATTSGWFIPSIGQVWDMLANLGGGEMAEHLKKLKLFESDVTYYYREGNLNLTYNPVEQLNSVMSLVPEDQKETFVHSRVRSNVNICELMSTSLYNNEEGNICIFWLYESNSEKAPDGTQYKGQIEPTAGYVDDAIICRPILAF